jgi:lysozyme
LLKSTSTRAWLDAATFIDRENFIQMPPEVQRVLQNMAFQLGLSKLQGFVQFKQALLNRDFSSAARAMLDSKWATQTPKRARRLAEEIASLD